MLSKRNIAVFTLVFLQVILLQTTVRAQHRATDSLKATLSVVADTQKVHNCIRISSYYNRVNADSCLHYAEKALALASRLNEKRLMALAKLQVAVHGTNTAMFDKGTSYAMEAFSTLDSLNDYDNAAYAANLIGNAALGAGNKSQALKWYRTSLLFGEKGKNEFKIAVAMFGMANVEFELKVFDSAFVHYGLCEELFTKLGKTREAIGSGLTRADISYKLGRTQQSIDLLTKIKQDVFELNDNYYLAYFFYQRGLCQRVLHRYVLALADMHTALTLFKDMKSFTNVCDAYQELGKTHYEKGNADSAYFYSTLYIYLNDSLFTANKLERMAEIETRYQTAEKDKLLLENNLEIRDRVAEVEEQESRQVLFIIGLCVMMVLVILAFMSYRRKRRDNLTIAAEKRKSDELLLNILPAETAEELKISGTAKARNFEMVTVMFTDFKGFTTIAEKLSAVELVAEINEYFIEFDNIVQRHGVEKIKTIGDAYMAVGGLPTAKETHAEDVIQAALEIQEFVAKKKIEKGNSAFEIRIGVHSGPVVAGIVGIRKFAYDVWGDTVNTASRVESAGINGCINASAATYELIKDKFKCIQRGKVDVKGKGEIEMYFVVPENRELVMDFYRAEKYVIDLLSSRLPQSYFYHNVNHTLDVINTVAFLTKAENFADDEEITLLRTAAAYHDTGFLYDYANNKAAARKYVSEILPKFGYSESQIASVQRYIQVVELQEIPMNKMECIMKDADLDYLGRDDYWDIAFMLRKEWESVGIKKTDKEWFELQIEFLTTHKFHTATSQGLRNATKTKNIEVLRKLLANLEAKKG